MAGIIAGGCFSADRRYSGFLLIQIILLGVNIGWSHLLIVPGLIGNDPWFHEAFTSIIVNQFHIPGENTVYAAYSDLPVFHLMVAATTILSALIYKLATILSVSLGQIIGNTLIVFLLADRIFKNHRVGLFAALAITIASSQIQWTYISIPNGFGGIFWLFCLYLLIYRKNFILLVILMADIIMTHLLVSFMTAISLLVVYMAYSYREIFLKIFEDSKILLIPVIFSIEMIGWLVFQSNLASGFVELTKSFDLDFSVPTFHFNSTVTISEYEYLFRYLGIFLYYSIAMVGILYMISLKGGRKPYIISWISLTVLMFPLGFLVIGIANFEARFIYFCQILLSIPFGLAIYLIGTRIIKNEGASIIFVIGLFTICSFLSVMSINAADENHIFAPVTGNTQYYTQSEIFGTQFLSEKINGEISSDYSYAVGDSSSILYHVFGIDFSKIILLDPSLNSGDFSPDGSVKIIRDSYVQDLIRKGFLSPKIESDVDNYLFTLKYNRVFDNHAMTAYID